MQRYIERAWSTRDGSLSAILLDWSEAFDRVDPAAMHVALARFGLPDQYLAMISAMCNNRTFEVRDRRGSSAVYSQGAGIAQGCPLSPYLFIIVLT
eukprot:7563944-Pyramimonas_sp.AAC.1